MTDSVKVELKVEVPSREHYLYLMEMLKHKSWIKILKEKVRGA